MSNIPRPIPKLDLFPYTYAAEDIAGKEGLTETEKNALQLEMAEALRRGQLQVRNPHTAGPSAVTPGMENPSPYVLVKDINDWLINEGRPYKWTPSTLAPSTNAENVKLGITKNAVINAFEGLPFDRDQWSRALANVPNWLKTCRVTPGKRGNNKTSATWNPALIAVALLDKKVSIRKLDSVFVDLKEWAEEWNDASANER